MHRTTLCLSVAGLCLAAGGCTTTREAKLSADALREKGLVIILPGIEGNSPINEHIRQGLRGAGITCAVDIHPWGFMLPVVKLAVNQINVPGNRAAGRKIAGQIAAYQDRYPDRPVYLVGHSGGAGIAVFALEALDEMPGDRHVAGVVLLSASLSCDYDLTTALGHSREGIVNFYNDKDIILLGLGTRIMGNVDGGRAASAGRVGFQEPAAGDAPSGAAAYKKLYQVRIVKDMVDDTTAPHVASTSAPFISAYVAEWIIEQGWPPPRRTAIAR